ncbi:hypothetical protein SORBI_3008G122400 [Sorghum bicolor]|uniref:DRBM domain-containing protein n=1 Tax=Sorghum bicolor TaxID=4558 RepID=A0A1Z5R672_SORBI|nr:hypothetical protein SORBI_3008G122400 [Sorghum bicolor]
MGWLFANVKDTDGSNHLESSQDSGVRRSRTHNATLKVASARPAASQAASRSPPRPTPRDVACHRQARCPPVLDGGSPRDRLPYNSPPPCHSEPSTKQLAVSPSSSCHPPVPSHPSARRKQRPPRKPHQPPAAQNPSRPSDLLMVMEQQIRGASGTGSEVPVVNKPEDAVPVVLPLGPIDREEALLPATQEAVAHQVVKEVDDSGTNNYGTSKNTKDNNTIHKRKFEALETNVATNTNTEHGDGQSPTEDIQASVQMDKNRTENNSKSRNIPQDIIVIPDVDPVINDQALKSQKGKVTEKSDGITCNMYFQRYATLRLLQKMRDDTLHEHHVLGDRNAEYEMDIQTLLTEMTPKLTSILKKHENIWKTMEAANPISSGEGCQTMNIKRKKLKEALLLRNNCQELDDICHESNWILPRYSVLPSVTGDMYQASVHLTGPDFNLSADGDMKVTPHDARDSAASNMLSQLQQKAREDLENSMSAHNP